MDFDAKIVWKPGMALTASVLRHKEDDIEEMMRAFRRTVIGSGRAGLLPGYEYCSWGGFSGKTYELNGLKLTAVLPSGHLIHVDEDLRMDIPSLGDGDYFLVLVISDRVHEFEVDEIPYQRPEYDLSLIGRDELAKADVFPIKRFTVSDGVLDVDEQFIPPVMSVFQNELFGKFISSYADSLSGLCSHPNMQEGDCRRNLLRYLFKLKSFDPESPVGQLVKFLEEISYSLEYYVVEGLASNVADMPEDVVSLKADKRRTPMLCDIGTFLRWFDEYLSSIVRLMDRVVIEDDSIDYEQLKKDIENNLYSRLKEELASSIFDELHGRLTPEITESVCNTVRRYLEDELSPELKEYLRGQLHESLYSELYDSLYSELSKLQYRPAPEEEDTFNPVI